MAIKGNIVSAIGGKYRHNFDRGIFMLLSLDEKNQTGLFKKIPGTGERSLMMEIVEYSWTSMRPEVVPWLFYSQRGRQ